MNALGRILIVTGEPGLAHDLLDCLVPAGYIVPPPVSKGEEVLARSAEAIFDLVLLDMDLPGPLDAIQAAVQVRAITGVPVMYLTARPADLQSERARATRPVGFVRKPLSQDDLLAAVEIALAHLKNARELAALRLLGNEQRYRAVINTLYEGLVLYDVAGTILEANDSAREILGHTLTHLHRRTSFHTGWRLINEDGSPMPARTHPAYKTLQTGKPVSQVIMGVLVPTGELRWVSVNTQPITNPGEGRPSGVVASYTDITTQRRAQQAAHTTEEKLRMVTETIDHVVWIATPKLDRMVYINPAYERLWQQSVDEVYKSPHLYIRVIHPDDLMGYLDNFRQYHAQGVGYELEYRIVPADGSLHWIRERGFPILDEQGRTSLMVGTCTDITAFKNLEQALAGSERFSRETLDALPVQVAVLNSDGDMLMTNGAWREFAGRSGADLTAVVNGANYLAACDASPAEVAATHTAAQGIRAVARGDLPVFDLDYQCQFHIEKRWFHLHVSRFGGDGAANIVVTHEDITHFKVA